MATKTITLNGAEQRVDSLGGLNALIVNNTDEPVYASAKAGVVPYADGVTEIKAGDTRTVFDTNGTVYLLGNGGRVELTGGINFNQPSQSSGGGGGVTRAEVNNIVTEKIAEVVANAPEDFDTLKEISDWIEGHEDSAAAMNSKINSNTADISDIQTEQETQDSDISALQTEMGQKADIGNVSNPNLLDNPDFRVNQRNANGTISAAGYFVDRWKLVSGTVTVNSDGTLTLNGTIEQILENPAGTYTIASASAGTASYSNTNKVFTLTGNNVKIEWAKLEIGNKATQFVPPNPALELLRCQRYYWKSQPASVNYSTSCLIPFFVDETIHSATCILTLNNPVTMRTSPSLKVNGSSPGDPITLRNTVNGHIATGFLGAQDHFNTYDGAISFIPLANLDNLPMLFNMYEGTIELSADL